MIARRASTYVGWIVGVILITAAPLPAQTTFFHDQFDVYPAGFPPEFFAVWPNDGCSNGRVSDNQPFSAPHAILQPKDVNDNHNLGVRHRHDFTPAEIQMIPGAPPNANVVRGTDEDFILFQYYLHLGTPGSSEYYRHNRYMEIACGTDRAPTPMLTTLCSNGETVRRYLNPDGDGQVHASLAVGAISMTDTTPCGLSGVNDDDRHETFRISIYDGRFWHELKDYPVPNTNIRMCNHYNFITLYIYASTFDVAVNTTHNGTNCNGPRQIYRVNGLPRYYTGDFTGIVMGGVPDEENGGCINENSPGVNIPANGYTDDIDDVILQAGVAAFNPEPCGIPIPPGACCLPNGTCQDSVDFDTCEAMNGEFQGASSACATSSCCLDPVFDVVGGGVNGDEPDGAVDQQDFGYFQTCITGPTDPDNVFDLLPDKCRCMDVTSNTPGVSDNAIDQNEFGVFQICATGPSPGTPVDPACDDTP